MQIHEQLKVAIVQIYENSIRRSKIDFAPQID